MTDFEQARRLMVDNQLRTSGVTDRRLLAAMGAVARERFVPEVRRTLAYTDAAPLLGKGRRLSAPAPFARLLQLAAVDHDEHVLDVGCASGYSTAVIARLAASVVGVDDDAGLLAEARANLAALGVGNAAFAEGASDSAGKSRGPYDVIVVEGAVEEVPVALFGQLKDGGRLVAAIARDGRPAVAHLFAKSGKGVAARAEFDASLPPLPRAQEERFVF